jgi:predicted nucleotidyltransferase
MEPRVIPPDHASMRQTEMGEAFNRVLFKALDAIEERQIPFGLIGGIAVSGMGRPRSTHDIDIFVRPEDADAALDALAKAGFETEKTFKSWLYKGWMEEMMVDIIFKSSGDLYFDDEVQAHAKPIMYHGRSIPAVAPEDLIIIKAMVHSEIGPHHWHDALALLSHAQIDWDYLLKRARRGQRRILSLLIYAQSNDVWIPNEVIVKLAQNVFGDSFAQAEKKFTPKMMKTTQPAKPQQQQSQPSQDLYLLAHVHEALAADPRCGAIDVELNVGGNRLAVKGEAQSHDHRQAIEDVVRECAKGFTIDNQVRVAEVSLPTAEEVV